MPQEIAYANAVQYQCARNIDPRTARSNVIAIELSTVFEAPPRPMMELQMARTAAVSADVPTPINPGEFVVYATVTARWPLLYGAGTAARCQ